MKNKLLHFRNMYDLKDPKIFYRLPKNEFKSFVRIECPVIPNYPKVRGYADHEIKNTIKRVR